jgi:hypothetical protein
MRLHFKHKASIGNAVLLIAFYGCVAIPASIVEAQENHQEISGAPKGVLKPALGDMQRGRVNDTRPGELAERRYKVEALSFRCIDEDWYDFWGSDEVTVSINYPLHHMTFTGIFIDVDSDDKPRSFGSGYSCILPITIPPNLTTPPNLIASSKNTWACTDEGISGPFGFEVWMHEMDRPNLEDPPIAEEVPDGGDELMGRRDLYFTAEELARAMPNVNDTFDETINLGACFDEQGIEGDCLEIPILPTGPWYEFTYRLTRLPDRPPVIGLVP